MTTDVERLLRDAYDQGVAKRELMRPPRWELEQRDAFLRMLQHERCQTLLELGAATGNDAAVFSGRGFAVTCVDLSPEMVRRCREKGLTAHAMSVTALRFAPRSFDAVFARNCLVHVPQHQLEATLTGIARVLRPGGIFYLSLYGGREFEGVWDGDSWEPKRFFSFHTDATLHAVVARVFDVHSFTSIPEGWGGLHYQSLILRKPARDSTPQREAPLSGTRHGRGTSR